MWSFAIWIVARTSSASEISITEELKAASYQAYCPKARIQRIHARKKYWAEEALFQRYIFLDVLSQDDAFMIFHKFRRRLSNLIHIGHDLAIVPNAVIRSIQAREIDGYITIEKSKPWRPKKGDPVVVKTGLFAGADAIFERSDGAHRAAVLLKWLGNEMKASIRYSELQAKL